MPERPAQEAIERLEKIVRRSKRGSTVQLPQGFARDTKNAVPDPVLAGLLRHGNGLLVKVYLTVVMAATSHPHKVQLSNPEIAEALGLPDPGGNGERQGAGARRVRKAMAELEKRKLVRREPRHGHAPITHVLDGRGAGEDLGDLPLGKPWITLPIALWKRGWFIALSPRAIAVLVVLRELTYRRSHSRGTYVDGVRKRQYGLSDDTWTRATRELEDAGLLTVEREVYEDRGEPRRRNLYTLRLDLLSAMDPGGAVPTTPVNAD